MKPHKTPFSAYYFLKVYLHHFSKTKKQSKRCHKTVEIKVLLTIFAEWEKDPDLNPDPYLWLMEPDPDSAGPKTCGSGESGSGFGSADMQTHNWPYVVLFAPTNLNRGPLFLNYLKNYLFLLRIWVLKVTIAKFFFHRVAVKLIIATFKTVRLMCSTPICRYAAPQDAIFCKLPFEGIFTSFFKDKKKSKRSHKTVEIKVFLTIFAERRIRIWIRIHTSD